MKYFGYKPVWLGVLYCVAVTIYQIILLVGRSVLYISRYVNTTTKPAIKINHNILPLRLLRSFLTQNHCHVQVQLLIGDLDKQKFNFILVIRYRKLWTWEIEVEILSYGVGLIFYTRLSSWAHFSNSYSLVHMGVDPQSKQKTPNLGFLR